MSDIAVQLTDLKKTYANGHTALHGISFSVRQGDFFALLGRNGAGKSTVIGIISSLVQKTAGKVEIFGIDIDRDFPRAKQMLGVVPQEMNFSIFETPLQIVQNQAGYYGLPRRLARERAEHYLNELSLWEKRNAQAQTLSGGMRRRLMIARALVNEPKLLILDEPTAGVDIEIRRHMWEYLVEINRAGTTIILTTHYLEEAERLCRHVAIIEHGRLLQNTGMADLLGTLQHQTYRADLETEIASLPTLPGIAARLETPRTLELTLTKGQRIGEALSELEKAGVRVVDVQHKANRLEQMFLQSLEPAAEPAEL